MVLQLQKITKTILIIAVLLLPAAAFSQKLVKLEVDKFTNDTVSVTSMEKLATTETFTSTQAAFLNAYVSRTGTHIFLNFEHDVTTENNQYFLVSQGDVTMLKLDDNTIIKLANDISVHPDRKDIKKGFVQREYFSVNIGYGISKEDINKLLTSTLTTVCVGVDNQNFDVKPKDSDVLKKMFKLVLGQK